MLLPKIRINNQTWTTYTLVYSDQLVIMNNASANTLTIPLETTVNFSICKELIISQWWAWNTTVVWATWVSINWINWWSVSMSWINQAVSVLKIWTNSFKIFNV